VTFDPFHVDLDGMLGLSRLHADAATELNDATGSALARAAGIDAAHGSIGTRVTGAFGEVLEARHGALSAASHTCGELSNRLSMAVQAYARGDESGAESVRAAAEAMDRAPGSSGTPVDPGSSATPATSGTVGAAESGGVADALGQQGGQLAQSAVQHAGGPEQPTGGGAYAVDSDLASSPPVDEQAERLSRD
jgi:hypothetical protein